MSKENWEQIVNSLTSTQVENEELQVTLQILQRKLKDREPEGIINRMMPLYPFELDYLENKLGLKRKEQIASAEWYSLLKRPGSVWGLVFGNSDEDYHEWHVWKVDPECPDETVKLICINVRDSEREEILMGLVTLNELRDLTEALEDTI